VAKRHPLGGIRPIGETLGTLGAANQARIAMMPFQGGVARRAGAPLALAVLSSEHGARTRAAASDGAARSRFLRPSCSQIRRLEQLTEDQPIGGVRSWVSARSRPLALLHSGLGEFGRLSSTFETLAATRFMRFLGRTRSGSGAATVLVSPAVGLSPANYGDRRGPTVTASWWQCWVIRTRTPSCVSPTAIGTPVRT
jgi:hypothetical protein